MDIKPANKWIADRIRQAIQEEHTTEKAVSDATGIAWATFYRRLRGGGSFDWDELMRIATALNRSPAYFTPPQFQHSKEAA